MVLELESLSASLKVALELPELRTIGVVGQVPLELRQVRELLGADRARLKQGQARLHFLPLQCFGWFFYQHFEPQLRRSQLKAHVLEDSLSLTHASSYYKSGPDVA